MVCSEQLLVSGIVVGRWYDVMVGREQLLLVSRLDSRSIGRGCIVRRRFNASTRQRFPHGDTSVTRLTMPTPHPALARIRSPRAGIVRHVKTSFTTC
jgi:hypothetical protein